MSLYLIVFQSHTGIKSFILNKIMNTKNYEAFCCTINLKDTVLTLYKISNYLKTKNIKLSSPFSKNING